MQENELTPQRYMSWPVLSLLVFITVIGFENIFYPFQNQGLSVVINWVILLIVYIVPYALIAAQLGTTLPGLMKVAGWQPGCGGRWGIPGVIGPAGFIGLRRCLIWLTCPMPLSWRFRG